jgi:muramoyltetrapeptide carboxypeptidase
MTREITFNRVQDEIAIVAPSSGCQNAKEKLLAGVKLLESKGFTCKYDENILSAGSGLDYFASSKKQRSHELKNAIFDPKVKIIWAFRGGYGASEIVFDLLELSSAHLDPKIIIGFSDITVLLLLFNQKFKMPAIHASVINSLVDKQVNMLDPIISVLSGKDMVFLLEPLNNIAKNTATIDAKITGGNLSIICHMIGSSLTIDTNDKIIFLEDVNEKGYHVHRYLLQMKNAGLFSRAKALIIGDFSASDDMLKPSIQNFCREYLTIPVFKTQGIGHLTDNYPIIIGANAQVRNNYLTITSFLGLI